MDSTTLYVTTYVKSYMETWSRWVRDYAEGKSVTPPNPATAPEAAAHAAEKAMDWVKENMA